MCWFDLILLNTGAHTHLFLGSGTSSALNLAFCSPGLVVHLDWSILADLHGSDHYPVNLHISTPSPTVSRHPKWITKHADWAGFSQSLIFEDQEFPSVNSMVEYFRSTVFRAVSQYVPQSSTTPHLTPVLWWTDHCRDAIRARKRAPSHFRAHPKLENLISFKRFRANAQRVICEAKHTSWKAFVSPGPHVRMLCGTNYGVCQLNVIGPSYLVSLLVVLSLRPKQISPTQQHLSHWYAVLTTMILVLEQLRTAQKHCALILHLLAQKLMTPPSVWINFSQH
jgi:hypothetical protein